MGRGTGRARTGEGGKVTGRLLVVTAPHFNGEDYEHDLVSAFPAP